MSEIELINRQGSYIAFLEVFPQLLINCKFSDDTINDTIINAKNLMDTYIEDENIHFIIYLNKDYIYFLLYTTLQDLKREIRKEKIELPNNCTVKDIYNLKYDKSLAEFGNENNYAFIQKLW